MEQLRPPVSGGVVLNGPVDFQWISLQEISCFAFPKANLKFIELLHQNPAL